MPCRTPTAIFEFFFSFLVVEVCKKFESTVKLNFKAKLKPGIHGVILSKGWRQSTFLPQVWEQLPDTKTFLEQLCMKAGLPADAWQKGDIEVLTYQVQYFEESG